MEPLRNAAEWLNAPHNLFLTLLAGGVFITIVGIGMALAGPTPEMRRLRAIRAATGGILDTDLVVQSEFKPRGFLKAFVPNSKSDSDRLKVAFRRAGLHDPKNIARYFTVRTFLAFLLPMIFFAMLAAEELVPALSPVSDTLESLSWATMIQLTAGLVLVGFYGPGLWLRQRIRLRTQAIEFALPNALDLMQVAVEAGLSFDAAMTRVGNEIAPASPALAEEFLIVQMEIQAGKERERALVDLGERTGILELASFASVVMQSSRFGTSISDALQVYAEEMRSDREIKAQERANKLPVQMSAIMAGIMMPTLLMICLSPVLIRFLRMAAETN